MAGNSKNSVTIDVAVDFNNKANSAQKMAKNISKNIEPLTNMFNLASKALEKTPEKFVGKLTYIRTALKSLGPAIENAKFDLQDFYNDIGLQSRAFETANKRVNEYAKEIARLQRELVGLNNSKTATRFVGSSEELREAEYTVINLSGELQKLEQQYYRTTKVIEANRAEVDKLKSKIKDEEEELKYLKVSLQTARSPRSIMAYTKRQEELTDKIKRQKEQIANLNSENRSLGGVLSSSKAKIKALTSEYEAASAEQDRLSQRVELTDEELAQYNARIAETTNRIKRMKEAQAGISLNPSDYVGETFHDKISSNPEEFRQYWQTYEEGAKQSGDAIKDLENRLIEILRTMGLLPVEGGKLSNKMNTMSQITRNLGKVAKSVFSDMKRAIRKVISVVGSLVGHIKNLFTSFSKGNKSLNFNHKKLFKTFLQFGLGVRSLYFLIRRMRTEFINGMKKMAASIPEVNQQISALTRSFYELKGSAVTMIQPILATVIPALVRLMNVLSAAMEKIAHFFAVLRGQKYVYKATAANVDYANSVEGVGDSAKEANKELAEYDNLLVIPQDNNGAGGGGGGGGGDDSQYDFDTPVKAMSDFAKKLKEAWEKGDYEGVGKVIAEKLNSITKTIDNWILKKFEPKGKIWANRIARVANGFFDGWDAELSGKTIADFFNAVINIVDEFATTFDWAKAGEKIGTMIVTAISKFDATKAAKTVRDLVGGMLTAGVALLAKNPGGALGKKLAEFIYSLFDTDGAVLGEFIVGIVENVADFFVNVFNGVADAVENFLSKNPFKGVGKKLGEAVNKLIHGVDWNNLTKQLGDLFMLMLNGLKDFVDTVDWEGIGKAIGDFLTNIDWWGILTTVANAIFKAFTGVLKGLLSTSGGRAFVALFVAIKGLKLAFTLAGPHLTKAADKLIMSVLDSISTLPGKIKKLAPKVGKSLKGLMGKQVTSGVGAAGIAGSAVAGVGAAAAGVGLGLTASDIIKPGSKQEFIDAFNDTYSAKSLGGNIKIWAKEWGNIFSNLWSDIKKGTVGQWEDTKKTVVDIAGKIKTGALTQWKTLKTNLGTIVDNIKTNASTSWKNLKTNTTTVFENIKSSVTEKWKLFKTGLGTITDGIKTKTTEVWGKIKTWLIDTVGGKNGIKEKVVGSFKTVKESVEGWSNKLKTSLKTIWEGISGVIKTPINWILAGVESLANGVINGINALIRALNSVKFTVPDWIEKLVPAGNVIAGKSFGFNIGYLNNVSLPRLAQGAVIPPNKEFLAVLGDQSRGTNIEAPLDTIKQALAEVMAEFGSMNRMPEKIQVVLPNGKVLAQTVWEEERKYYKQTGSYSPKFS